MSARNAAALLEIISSEMLHSDFMIGQPLFSAYGSSRLREKFETFETFFLTELQEYRNTDVTDPENCPCGCNKISFLYSCIFPVSPYSLNFPVKSVRLDEA
jgi:hypothetical protein